MNAGRILIGVGAGLVSALLLATVASGSPLAFALVCLSPLPLMIVGLGWSPVAAAAGSLVASLALGLLTVPAIGLVYLVGVGGPAVWLAYLALLGRPAAESGDAALQRSGGMEWYPVGQIVWWLAVVAALLGLAFVAQFGFAVSDYLAGVRASTEASFRALERFGSFTVPPAGPEREALIRFMSLLVPIVLAATAFLVLVLNVWIAGRVVVKSGRSPRPWPDVAFELELPRVALIALAASLALSMTGPDIVGMAAGFLATTLILAFALQGLAVLHVVTRGAAARVFLLLAVYIALFVAFGPALAPLGLLGVAEPFLKLRARWAARRGPPPPKP